LSIMEGFNCFRMYDDTIRRDVVDSFLMYNGRISIVGYIGA
jgi:hypothetical protein